MSTFMEIGPAVWSTSWKAAVGVEGLPYSTLLPDSSLNLALLALLFFGGFSMAFVKYLLPLSGAEPCNSFNFVRAKVR